MSTRRLLQLLLAVPLFAVAGRASALPSGTLAITDHAMDPKSGSLDKDLKKAMKSAIARSGDSWHLYFVAFLKKEAGAPEVNIVFYELTDGKTGAEEVNAYPIQTQPKAKILMSEIEISPDQGFKEGKKYDVRITRLVGGHEEVYAHAPLTLR